MLLEMSSRQEKLAMFLLYLFKRSSGFHISACCLGILLQGCMIPCLAMRLGEDVPSVFLAYVEPGRCIRILSYPLQRLNVMCCFN